MARKSSSPRPSFDLQSSGRSVESLLRHRRKGDNGNALFIVHAGMLKVAMAGDGRGGPHEIQQISAEVDLGSMEVMPGKPSSIGKDGFSRLDRPYLIYDIWYIWLLNRSQCSKPERVRDKAFLGVICGWLEGEIVDMDPVRIARRRARKERERSSNW